MRDWMDDLTPEIQMIGAYVDAQPQTVREAFQYCLALMMVESGKAQLVETIPGDEGIICHFETVAGDSFAIKRPVMSQNQEAEILEAINEILRDEGL